METNTDISMQENDNPYQNVSKSKISLVRSLETKKFRTKEGLFAVQGAKSVEEALKTFTPVFVCATPAWTGNPDHIADIATDRLYIASETQMQRMSSLKNAPEVIAVFPLPEEDTGIPLLDAGKLYILLDGIQDPGNLGTILRTADWFGIEEIFCSPSTVDIYNPKALMATMGSMARTCIRYMDLESLINANPDMPIYGTLLDGKDIYNADLTPGGIIVLGNEGSGLTSKIRNLVTEPLQIPPYHPDRHAESLNVGAAAAVVISEFRRRFPLV